MSSGAAPGERPDYGIDAPGVIRNLFAVGALGLATWATAALGLWQGRAAISVGGAQLVFPLSRMGLWTAGGTIAMGVWMLWESRVGKVRERERLLDRIAWSGAEQVLDVGCGRGLMMIGAARRLTGGKAIGIDIWQAEDLSGNRPEAPLENARREGVADRVEVRTADMRALPFPDGTFDVVVSCAAIHNLYSAPDRAKAIREIARVLKGGGHALVDDIRHGREYAETFHQNGCRDIRNVGSVLGSAFLALVTFGSLRPSTIFATKAR